MGDWKWVSEGDDNILATMFNDHVWKIDENRGLTRESKVEDYAVRLLREEGKFNPDARWAATTKDLTIQDHIKTMEVFSRYVDSAISKTVNIPHDYPYEDFKKLYMAAYSTGTIKGCTTYREGTTTAVLSTQSSLKDNEGRPTQVIHTIAPKRPDELPCDIHNLTAVGQKWIVLVGILGDAPYEIFAFKENGIKIPPRFKTGKVIRKAHNKYNLECGDGELVISDLSQQFEKDEHEAITRLMSAALRHGTQIDFLVSQLKKAHGTVVSFAKALARTLNKYVKQDLTFACEECGGTVVMIEGCMKCRDCATTKCG